MSRFLLSCANRCGAAFVLALLVGPMVLAEEIYYQVGFTNRLRLADTDVGTDVLIGSMGPADDSLGMSFSPEGVLYGYNRSTSSLYTIDTTTAATTLVGANGLQAVESLTFDATGSTLYATSGSQLYAMDPADATATLIGALGTS